MAERTVVIKMIDGRIIDVISNDEIQVIIVDQSDSKREEVTHFMATEQPAEVSRYEDIVDDIKIMKTYYHQRNKE